MGNSGTAPVCFGRSACHPGLSWYAAGPRPAGRYRCHLPDRRHIPTACICPAARCILYMEAPGLFHPLSFSSRSRGLVARVHCDKLYFVEFPCDFIIYGIPCHTVVDVSCRYLHTENKPAFVADCMCLIRKLPFMLSFYEHSAVRVCCGDRLFCCLSAAGILWIAVVIVFLLDRLLPQLFALCIDLPATFTCISRYVCRSDAIPNRCWFSTILISTTGSIPGRSVCQKTIVFLFCVGFPRLA